MPVGNSGIQVRTRVLNCLYGLKQATTTTSPLYTPSRIYPSDIVLLDNYDANNQYCARVLFSKNKLPPLMRHSFPYIWYTYHRHLTSTIVYYLESFQVILLPTFQQAQTISNTPENDTTMAVPLVPPSPTILIQESPSVSPVKQPYLLSFILLPDTWNNDN